MLLFRLFVGLFGIFSFVPSLLLFDMRSLLCVVKSIYVGFVDVAQNCWDVACQLSIGFFLWFLLLAWFCSYTVQTITILLLAGLVLLWVLQVWLGFCCCTFIAICTCSCLDSVR